MWESAEHRKECMQKRCRAPLKTCAINIKSTVPQSAISFPFSRGTSSFHPQALEELLPLRFKSEKARESLQDSSTVRMYASLHCEPDAMRLIVLSPSLSFFWFEAAYQASHTFFLSSFCCCCGHSWPDNGPFTTNVNTTFCAQKLTHSFTTSVNAAFCAKKLTRSLPM